MTNVSRRYWPGDPVLAPHLPGNDGRSINLAHQSRAGRVTLLAFGTHERLDRLETERAQIDAAENSGGAFYAVATDAAEDAGHRYFLDIGGRLARQFTGEREGIAVLSAASRLAAIFPLDRLGDAVRLALELGARTPPRRTAMQAPVLLIEQVLEPELCARAIACWEAGEKVTNAVSRGSSATGAAKSIKRRTDVILGDGPLFAQLKERMAQRVLPEMYKAFRTRIASMEALRIGCYDADERGAFERHRDNTTPQTAHRGFAVSLNLNDDYEGGAVRFPEYDRAEFAPEVGGALVFSCALLHEALPVTSGRRFALFSFLNDTEGAAQECHRLQSQARQGARRLPGLGRE